MSGSRRGGTRSTTAASSATCARATASCTTASAASASCASASATRWCSRRTAAVERLLHRSDREEAAQPLLSRHERAVVRHRRLQPRAASSARTGTSRRRARWTGSPTRPRPRRSRARAKRAGCTSVAFTYNDPAIFAEYAMDVADACHARRRQDRRGDRRLHPRRAARASSTRRWTPRTSTSRRSPRSSTRSVTPSQLEPVLGHAARTSCARPRCGPRSRRCSSPGSTTPTPSSTALSRVDRRRPRPRRAAALLGVPSRLQDDRLAADAAGDAAARAAQALEAGLRYVYTGNVHDSRRRHDVCPCAARRSIERDWYEILDYRLSVDGALPEVRTGARRAVRCGGRQQWPEAEARCDSRARYAVSALAFPKPTANGEVPGQLLELVPARFGGKEGRAAVSVRRRPARACGWAGHCEFVGRSVVVLVGIRPQTSALVTGDPRGPALLRAAGWAPTPRTTARPLSARSGELRARGADRVPQVGACAPAEAQRCSSAITSEWTVACATGFASSSCHAHAAPSRRAALAARSARGRTCRPALPERR